MLHIDGKEAIDGNDTWLRLNQNNDFTSGTYTPYKLQIGTTLIVLGSTIDLGHATDTTISRVSAGKLEVEGKPLIKHASATYNSGEVTFSTSAASGGSSGDIWFQYT